MSGHVLTRKNEGRFVQVISRPSRWGQDDTMVRNMLLSYPPWIANVTLIDVSA